MLLKYIKKTIGVELEGLKLFLDFLCSKESLW